MRQRATAMAAISNRRNPSLAAQVAAIMASFAGPKVWYDPSDKSTLYQDTAGGAVAAAGNPIGVMMDKAQSLARGPELTTNGDFGAGATGWTVSGADATHIATFAGGTLRYQSDTTTPQLQVSQPGILVAGKVYEFVFVISAWTSGSIKTDNAAISIPGAVGTYRFVAPNLSTTFNITRATTNVDMTIDSISIKEVLGNHAVQTSTPSRPLWQTTYAALDGVDDSWSTPSIDFTGTAQMTIIAGVRKGADTTGMLAELSAVSDTNAGAFAYLVGNGAANTTFRLRGSTVFTGQVFTTPAAPTQEIDTCQYDISQATSATQIVVRSNGAAATTTLVGAANAGTGNFGNYPLFIGRRNNTSLPFNGNLYGMLVIGRLLTPQELAICERYMAQQAGVTL